MYLSPENRKCMLHIDARSIPNQPYYLTYDPSCLIVVCTMKYSKRDHILGILVSSATDLCIFSDPRSLHLRADLKMHKSRITEIFGGEKEREKSFIFAYEKCMQSQTICLGKFLERFTQTLLFILLWKISIYYEILKRFVVCSLNLLWSLSDFLPQFCRMTKPQNQRDSKERKTMRICISGSLQAFLFESCF